MQVSARIGACYFVPCIGSLQSDSIAMAKRGSEAIETPEAKRRKWIETQMMKKHTIRVSTLDGRHITLNDVLGVCCLSHLRRRALEELRKLRSGDDYSKGRCYSMWEYDIVHRSTVLPSSPEDFKSRKHYVYTYLDTEDEICLIKTRQSASKTSDSPRSSRQMRLH